MTEPSLPARPSKRERTRQLIIETAAELFDERPWDEVSMEEIADAAGLVRTTLFNHFETKQLLLVSVCLAQLEDLAAIANRPAPVEPLVHRFKDSIWPAVEPRFIELLDALRGHPQMAKMLWRTMLDRRQSIPAPMTSTVEPMGEVLDRFQRIVEIALKKFYRKKKKELNVHELANFLTWQLLDASQSYVNIAVPTRLVDHYINF